MCVCITFYLIISIIQISFNKKSMVLDRSENFSTVVKELCNPEHLTDQTPPTWFQRLERNYEAAVSQKETTIIMQRN